MSKKTSVQPLGDRVLLRELSEQEKERKLDSGIILPETVKEDKGSKRGEVIAVGEGSYDDNGKLRPIPVKPGDIVLFSWGDDLKIDGEDFHIVSASNILAIVK